MSEKSEETPNTEPNEDGISEDDLRKLIGEELDSRLEKLTDGFGGIVDSIVGKLKGSTSGEGSSEGSSDDSLLEKIGNLIDEKLKGAGSAGNSAKPREPKIKIFS